MRLKREKLVFLRVSSVATGVFCPGQFKHSLRCGGCGSLLDPNNGLDFVKLKNILFYSIQKSTNLKHFGLLNLPGFFGFFLDFNKNICSNDYRETSPSYAYGMIPFLPRKPSLSVEDGNDDITLSPPS